MAYLRTVKTASGATAVQIVWSSSKGSRQIEHLGSAHHQGQLEALKAAGQQRLSAGQSELDLGLGSDASAPLPITSSRMAVLTQALTAAWHALGFEQATDADPVFRALVLARILEPTSKQDSLRVLAEAGLDPPAYRTLTRRLPGYATAEWSARLAGACAARAALGPASLVLYDVSTLHFEVDAGTGSVSPASPRNGAWTPRSRSGC